MKNKRILWICNHSTLMDGECNLLLSLGFEVFVPKILPLGSNSIDTRSVLITDKFDKSLSIPKEDLDILNNFNFYSNKPKKSIQNIINKYFSTLMCVTIYPGCFYLSQVFKGFIILRVFGHSGDMDYEKASTVVPNLKFLNKKDRLIFNIQKYIKIFRPKEITYFSKVMYSLNKIKNRVYLGAAYENIQDNEKPFFKNRFLYLPLGLPRDIWKFENSWSGSNNKIMFVCPSFDSVQYYNDIFDEFVYNFGDLPHAIFGKQKNIYLNKNIIGFLERDEYNKNLQNYKCMFYHSREPRHLHYHPLEAIIFGMPLIFMSGGALEHLSIKKQPGMANTIEEARVKIKRILDGDEDFIRDVLANQKELLNKFKDNFLEKTWKKNLLPIINKLS